MTDLLRTIPPWLYVGWVSVVGALIGSFAGAVADRLPLQMGLRPNPDGLTIASPRSHCAVCRGTVPAIYLIPVVGWALSRRRCCHCGVPISPVYPLVESSFAVASGLIAGGFGPTGTCFSALVFTWILACLAWLDLRETWLPEIVTLPFFWLGLIASPFEPDAERRILGAFFGFSLLYACQLLVSRSRRVDAIAGGDVTLAAGIGAWVGLPGAPVFLFTSAVLFLVAAVPARRRGVIMLPFGPALALGALAAAWLRVQGWPA